MSKAEAAKVISVSIHQLSQLAVTVMTSLILFFGKELYGDIKQLRMDSNLDKQSHSAQIEINRAFADRLSKLEINKP